VGYAPDKAGIVGRVGGLAKAKRRLGAGVQLCVARPCGSVNGDAVPIYVYEVILEDGDQGQVFEVVQKMSDPPLAKHPMTGQPVRRVVQAPHLPKTWTDRQARHTLGDKNIAAHGLARYERGNDGKFVKTAGSGPDSISAD